MTYSIEIPTLNLELKRARRSYLQTTDRQSKMTGGRKSRHTLGQCMSVLRNMALSMKILTADPTWQLTPSATD